MKISCNAFAVLMAALCTAGTAAALPLVWRADWPDAKPVETLVHRGTDVELQPTWYINGEIADSTNWTYSVYVQTNNQAAGEWFGPIPGTTFSHTNDIGAAMYQVMLRAETPDGAVNYTAFARLRMLDSPGFEPGELPLPVKSIDFSKVVAINAPWLDKSGGTVTGEIKFGRESVYALSLGLVYDVENHRLQIVDNWNANSAYLEVPDAADGSRVAFTSDISAAISPTSPAFSNAVLSVVEALGWSVTNMPPARQ